MHCTISYKLFVNVQCSALLIKVIHNKNVFTKRAIVTWVYKREGCFTIHGFATKVMQLAILTTNTFSMTGSLS